MRKDWTRRDEDILSLNELYFWGLDADGDVVAVVEVLILSSFSSVELPVLTVATITEQVSL